MTLFGKRLPFWSLILLSLACYSVLPIVFPLLSTYNRLPLSDVRTFTPTLFGGLGYALLFLILYGLYLLAWRAVQTKMISPVAVLLIAAAFSLPLLFTYPINATDVFRYFVRGRITAVYGESSLEVPPSEFPDDPFASFAGQWADETSPYGPLWELVAAGVTIVSGQNLLSSLLTFKLLGLLCHLGIGGLLWSTLYELPRAQRIGRTLLWAWNPALLYMFVIDAHNDALMMFWLVLGYWGMQRQQRPLLGMLLAVLSPLTKLIGLLPLPFFFLGHLRTLPTWRARFTFTALSTIGGLLLGATLFLPFGSPLELVERLIKEASGNVGFSPGVVPVLIAQRAGASGLASMLLDTLPTVAMFLLVLFALWLIWRTWKGHSEIRAAADCFGFYVLTALTFRLWYSIWPFPWLLLDKDGSRWRLRAELSFLLTVQLSVVLYGHIRAYLLKGDLTVAHFVGVPFTFALPLLLAFFVPSSQRSRMPQTETLSY